MSVVGLTVKTAIQRVNHPTTHGNGIEQESLGGPCINGFDGGNSPVGNSEIDGSLLCGGFGGGKTGICEGEQRQGRQ